MNLSCFDIAPDCELELTFKDPGDEKKNVSILYGGHSSILMQYSPYFREHLANGKQLQITQDISDEKGFKILFQMVYVRNPKYEEKILKYMEHFIRALFLNEIYQFIGLDKKILKIIKRNVQYLREDQAQIIVEKCAARKWTKTEKIYLSDIIWGYLSHISINEIQVITGMKPSEIKNIIEILCHGAQSSKSDCVLGLVLFWLEEHRNADDMIELFTLLKIYYYDKPSLDKIIELEAKPDFMALFGRPITKISETQNIAKSRSEVQDSIFCYKYIHHISSNKYEFEFLLGIYHFKMDYEVKNDVLFLKMKDIGIVLPSEVKVVASMKNGTKVMMPLQHGKGRYEINKDFICNRIVVKYVSHNHVVYVKIKE